MNKHFNLRNKIAFSCLGMAVLICISVCVGGYYHYRNYIFKTYNGFAYELANTALTFVDGDSIAEYLNTKKTDEKYDKMAASLYSLYKNTNMSSVYIAVPVEEDLSIVNIYDVRIQEAKDKELFAIGTIDPIASKNPMNVVNVYKDGISAKDYFIRKSSFGYNTAAIIPIFNSEGKTTAILVVDIPMTTIKDNLKQYILITVSLTAFVVIIFISIFLLYLQKRVVAPLNLIMDEALEFAENEKLVSKNLLNVKTKDEIEHLSKAIYKMQTDIKSYIENLASVTAEKERIGTELSVATQIQASMLPCIFPAFPQYKEVDIYASMTPAKEVGGDFYDFFLVDDNHLAIVIADVSGKGVPAALFMVIAKTLIKNSVQMGLSPKAVLEKVNNQLCENNEAQMFVTAWLGVLEISTGKMICSNGGHEYPAIRRKDGEFELLLDKHGFVLGGMEDMQYPEYEIKLSYGDRLFLYTDGVPDAINVNEELFGEERMIKTLHKYKNEAPKMLLSKIKETIDLFAGEAPQFDDITMVSFDYLKTTDEKPTAASLEISPISANLSKANGFFETFAKQNGISEDSTVFSQVSVAIDEIFSNIINYSTAKKAIVSFEATKEKIVITFKDDGIPYNPLEKEDPDTTLSVEERKIGGLGIFIVKKTMDKSEYLYKDGFNIFTIEKSLI